MKKNATASSIHSLKIIDSDYLRKIHRLHSLLVNWFAFSGTILAFILLTQGYAPGTLEISLFVIMWLLTQIGITVGFHRHFTHASFKANKLLRSILAALGSMAAQGTLFYWAALHRRHHEYSDQPDDPHSPYYRDKQSIGWWYGLWHSFIGWTIHHEIPNPNHYAPDLLKDKQLSQINQLYRLWVALGLLIPLLISAVMVQTLESVVLTLLWAGAVRIFITQSLVLSITSITHIFGFQSFKSNDRSTNNVWLVILTLGVCRTSKITVKIYNLT